MSPGSPWQGGSCQKRHHAMQVGSHGCKSEAQVAGTPPPPVTPRRERFKGVLEGEGLHRASKGASKHLAELSQTPPSMRPCALHSGTEPEDTGREKELAMAPKRPNKENARPRQG